MCWDLSSRWWRLTATSRPAHEKPAWLTNWLSPRPLSGIAEIAGIYVGLTIFGFLLEYLQTYFMQWAGQMVMFDLRSEIFRHLQRMHIGVYEQESGGTIGHAGDDRCGRAE